MKVRQSLEKIRSLNSRKNSKSREEVAVAPWGRVKSDFFLFWTPCFSGVILQKVPK